MLLIELTLGPSFKLSSLAGEEIRSKPFQWRPFKRPLFLTPRRVPMALVMDVTEEINAAGSGMSGIEVTELTNSCGKDQGKDG